MIALRAIAPRHHPLNRYAVTGGALRRVLVALLITVGGLAAMWVFLMLVAMAYGVTA